MNNFTYHNPTRIVFGKGSIAGLGKLVPPGKVLMTYGGGSIKKNGVYQDVKNALAGREVLEFGGIPPNPVYEGLLEAVGIVKSEKVDFLLAVGGGSVLDGTKFIACAARFEGPDPWNILARSAPVKSAVPLGAVLTLPATGSESNGYSVISRKSTQEKKAFGTEHAYPRFAILDPLVTMTLPEKQVRNGIVDAFAHVMEQYATTPAAAALQDRQSEAILKTLIEEGPKTLQSPKDYDARANLMWSATQALNGLVGCGVPQDWGTHMIGHELTALYGLDHAETLAIVMPRLLRHQKTLKAAKLLQFARRVWGLDGGDAGVASEAGIVRMEEFFNSVGMPTRLSAYGIAPAEAAAKVGERFRQRKARFGQDESLNGDDAAKILERC